MNSSSKTDGSAIKNLFFVALFVFFIALTFYSLTIGRSLIFSRGEGREAIVVTAMLDQGNYILPLRNGEDIPSKPPLFHWISADTSNILGVVNEFTIRFPSALSGALILAMFFWSVVRLRGKEEAILGSLLLATCFEWNHSIVQARVDAVFTLSLTILYFSSFFYIKSFKETGKANLKCLSACLLGGVLAILSKGPVGVLIPLASIFFFLIAIRTKPLLSYLKQIKIFFSPALCLVFAVALAGIWYLLAFKQQGGDFIGLQFFEENFARIVDVQDLEKKHERPSFFGVIYWLGSFMPWTLLLPVVGAYWWKNKESLKLTENVDLLFALIWQAIFILAVSVSQTKRIVYFLPVLPALAFFFAVSIKEICSKIEFLTTVNFKFFKISFRALAVLLSLVLIFVLLAPVVFDPAWLALDLSEMKRGKVYSLVILKGFSQSIWQVLPLIIGVGLVALGSFKIDSSNFQKAIQKICFGFLFVVFSVNFSFLPFISQIGSPKEFMKEVNAIVPPKETIFQHKSGPFFPAIFYARRNMPMLETAKELKKAEGHYLILREEKIEDVLKIYPDAKALAESDNLAGNGRDHLLLLSIPKS